MRKFIFTKDPRKRTSLIKRKTGFQDIQIFYSRRIGDNSSGIGMKVVRDDTLYSETLDYRMLGFVVLSLRNSIKISIKKTDIP